MGLPPFSANFMLRSEFNSRDISNGAVRIKSLLLLSGISINITSGEIFEIFPLEEDGLLLSVMTAGTYKKGSR